MLCSIQPSPHDFLASNKHNKMAGYKYEYSFLREIPDSLNCILCLDVAKEAYQHEDCGKLFCKSCYRKINTSSCPNCKGSEGEYLADKLSELPDIDVIVALNLCTLSFPSQVIRIFQS